MRQDQFEQFQKLTEKLADQVLQDADPDKWCAAGVPVNAMDRAQRGDAVWCRKLAAQSLTILQRCIVVVGTIQQASSGNKTPAAAVVDDEQQQNQMLAEARADAERLLEQARHRSQRSAAAPRG